MPAFVAIGVDSSDEYHDIHAEAPGANTSLRVRINNGLSGFLRLEELLRERFGDLPLAFAVENPTLLFSRYLIHRGEPVYAVNPRSVVRIREGLASSGKKDDPLDARSISLLLRERREELSPIQESSPDGAVLAGLVDQRTALVQQKTRTLNQLTICLKSFFPRALELFPNLEQPIALAFLAAFSSPSELAEAQREAWDQLFAGKRYPQPGRIAKLWELSRQPSVPVSPSDEELGKYEVRWLVRLLGMLLEELQQREADITARFEQLPDAKIFSSLPGAADVLAPGLFSVFGDNRDAWESWGQVARASGTVPITRRSGKPKTVMMRRHCNRKARRILHLFAGCSIRSCAWAREFYLRQRRHGKSHAAALRNLATKWLRIVFRMWKEGTVYDEAAYLKACALRQTTLAGSAVTSG